MIPRMFAAAAALALVGCTKGAAGPAGQSVAIAPEPAGAHCAYGGTSFTAADGTSYACNAAPASLATPSDAGLVQVESSSTDTSGGHVVLANDKRLSDARPASSIDFGALSSNGDLIGALPVAQVPLLAGDVLGMVNANTLGPGVGFATTATSNVKYVLAGARTAPSPDGSMARPFPTLVAAAAAAVSGDHFLVTGDFTESATFAQPVTLEGAGFNLTQIQGALTLSGAGDTTLRGISVQCSAASPCVSFAPAVSGSKLHVEGVLITQQGSLGASLSTTGLLDLAHSTLISGGAAALQISESNSFYANAISNSLVAASSTGQGVDLESGSLEVHASRLTSPGGPGLYVHHAANVTVSDSYLTAVTFNQADPGGAHTFFGDTIAGAFAFQSPGANVQLSLYGDAFRPGAGTPEVTVTNGTLLPIMTDGANTTTNGAPQCQGCSFVKQATF